MKKYTTLFLLLLSTLGTSAQEIPASDVQPGKKALISRTFKYDPQDKMIRRCDYEYNDQEKMSSKTEQCRNDSSWDYWKTEYVYDKQGNQIGRLVRHQVGENWLVQRKVVCKYDKQKQLLAEAEYVGPKDSMVITAREEYSYDDKGRMAGQNSYTFFHNQWKRNLGLTWLYDDKGTLLKKTEERMRGGYMETDAYAYTYDGKGRCTCEAKTHTGRQGRVSTEKTFFTYNEAGLPVRQEGPYLAISYDYEYDGPKLTGCIRSEYKRETTMQDWSQIKPTVCWYKYSYNYQNLLSKIDLYELVDGDWQLKQTEAKYSYDTQGRLVNDMHRTRIGRMEIYYTYP